MLTEKKLRKLAFNKGFKGGDFIETDMESWLFKDSCAFCAIEDDDGYITTYHYKSINEDTPEVFVYQPTISL